MRRLLRPLVVRLLRRDPAEIERRAAGFRIQEPAGRELVSRLGAAFLGGYHSMLEAASTAEVAAAGRRVAAHFRPFFFEGAAMGYPARAYHAADCTEAGAERALLGLDPAYRYLYYVGLGFWYGFRHARRPERLERLAPHLEPLYFPLCYDGFGFKLGFFDFPGDGAGVEERLRRCPEATRRFAYQGFGRASFFVTMDDAGAFRALRETLPPQHREDAELGRALAQAFTGVDRPRGLLRYVAEAAGGAEREMRLLGMTWALTARRMNDAGYFDDCLAGADPSERGFLVGLADLCEAALARAASYGDWQTRTRRAVREAYREWSGAG